MLMIRLATPIRPIPATRPSAAVAIGRLIATNEPKLINRISIAAATPTTVANPIPPDWVCWIAGPPSSTCKAGERADSAGHPTRSPQNRQWRPSTT
jgi:hypothetical protein